MRVLGGDASGAIDHQHGDIRALDCAARAHHGVPFHTFAELAGPPHPSRIDQEERPLWGVDFGIDRISRSARNVADDHSLLAEDGVQQLRLADVRPTDDCHAHAVTFDQWLGHWQLRHHLVQHQAHIHVMQSAHRHGVAQAKGRCLGDTGGLATLVVRFRGDDHRWAVDAPDNVRHVVVTGRQTIA